MADDQKPKTMDINDLVRELSKSSTAPSAPTPTPAPQTQAPRPSFPTPKPPMPPTPTPMVGSPSAPSMLPIQPKQSLGAESRTLDSSSKSNMDLGRIGAKPMTPPVSVPAPTTPPSAPGVKEYQSSIRTMNEDISKLKQGQKPTGIDVPRKVEQVIPVVPAPISPKPAVPSQQFKVPGINLGEAQKTGPLTTPRSMPTVPKVEPKSQIYVPQEGQTGGNRNMLFIGIGAVAVVAGFAYWFFVLRAPAPEVVLETPTPSATPTQAPTPTPSPLAKLGVAENVSIPSTSVFLSSLTTELSSRQPVAGQIKLLDIVDENQQKYSLKDFLTKLSIDTTPLNDSSGLLDTKEWVFGLYGQLGSSTARPFIVITQKDSTLATNLMNVWEPRMINDLAKLFSIGKHSAKLTFTPDVYSNVNFRFVRIPDRDLGVTYAVFSSYIVLGSSRDSFRAVIDTLTTP